MPTYIGRTNKTKKEHDESPQPRGNREFSFDYIGRLFVVGEQTWVLDYEMAFHNLIIEQNVAVLDTCN